MVHSGEERVFPRPRFISGRAFKSRDRRVQWVLAPLHSSSFISRGSGATAKARGVKLGGPPSGGLREL
jgi:hypothetical protein